jgi:membrane fusion protein (multidrug efflux system)
VQEATVQLAEAKLAKMLVKAPFKGMVGLRNVSVGDYVKEGQDLINIEDIGTLRMDFKLPETYLGRVSKGQVVEVTSDALPGQRFKAVLDAVDPLVDQNGRAISSRARLDNAAGKLRPGLFVRVRLLFGERQNVLMVPEQAIVPGGQPAVFKVTDGKAVMVKVRLGVRRAAQVEVLEGLAEGDVVVTAGQLKLRDGASVKPIGEAEVPATQPPVAQAPQCRGHGCQRKMKISETCIKRPVFATVLSLVIMLLGYCFLRPIAGARVPEDRRAGGDGRYDLPRRLGRNYRVAGDQAAGGLAGRY